MEGPLNDLAGQQSRQCGEFSPNGLLGVCYRRNPQNGNDLALGADRRTGSPPGIDGFRLWVVQKIEDLHNDHARTSFGKLDHGNRCHVSRATAVLFQNLLLNLIEIAHSTKPVRAQSKCKVDGPRMGIHRI
jgi:hypothetical protein